MSTSQNIVEHKVAHHFQNAEQELQSAKLGMWLFLCTEIMLFGGLFCAYIVFRTLYPEMFAVASSTLDWKLGGINTMVLITSSFTMALAVRSAQTNRFTALKINLIITLLCAVTFMVIKYFEYSHKIHEGTLWAGSFTASGFDDPRVPIFFGIYFLMTGLHGIHVVIGIACIIWLLFKSRRNVFYEGYFTPVEMVGLYWHLVDLVWIFLYPLLYLINGVKL